MSRRGWLMFLAMGLIWGIPYMLIKVAVDEFHPATIVLGRTLIAAAVLLPIAAVKGYLRPLLPHWRAILAFTAVEICGPWLLLGYAEQSLSSSLTGLLIAAVPLVGALLVWMTKHEHVDRRRVVGLLVGFAGVALLVGVDVGTARFEAVLAIAGVAVGYAVGPLILAKYLSHLPILGVVTASAALAAVLYLPIGLVQWPQQAPSAEAWLSVAGLGVICTGLAFLIFFALIAEVGPARATVITYINPAVAVTLGVIVLNEAFTVTIAVGYALILAGCILATARNRRDVPASREPVASRSPEQAAELA
ncbi:MAG TPA: DMT family transporter [Jiangellaceae bacterium]